MEEEIKANKRCLSGLCPNLARRYRLSEKAEQITSNIKSKLLESDKFDTVSHRANLAGIEAFSSKEFVQFESTKSTFDQIIEAMKDDKINVIGIYGMGGVGKTTLAKEVGKRVKELNIFNEVVLATVSQTPNVKNIQGQIADLLGLKFEEESEEGRAGRLLMRLKKEKKILIILDDVWAKLNLTSVGVPWGDDHKGCKILLTTRQKHVCSAMECESTISLNALNEEEGLALFKRNAGTGDELPIFLNDLAKEVARECKGLPLAIVTIGSALKGKGIDEWNFLCQKLKNSKFVDVDNVDGDIYACLKLSYDYLKDKQTKLCFLLCSLFPEDYEIPLENLVEYGWGLELYKDADSIEEARSHLRVMINNLKTSCLLLDGRGEKFVKMHDIVRDVALWITSSEGKKFMSKPGLGLRELRKHDGLKQYSAIYSMANQLEVLPVGLVCPELDILVLGGEEQYSKRGKVSNQFFVEMKALKVVSLSDGYMSLKSLQFLTNLRSLFLENCELEDISSVGMLSGLEILSFRYCIFEELAKELGELSKLRLLDLHGCERLKRIPAKVIGRLSQLEELYIGAHSFGDWDVEGTGAETSNASLYELNLLSCLTILSLYIKDHRIPKYFAFPILQRYQIGVNTAAFHAWGFHIQISHGCWADMPFRWLGYREGFFERGPQSELKISDFESTSLTAFKELFKTLQSLELKNLTGLRYVWNGCTEQLSLHHLTNVDVRSCPSLTCLFTVSLARTLVQLEKLEVSECKMKHIVAEEQFEDNNNSVADESDIVLPNLRKLTLRELEYFTSFCPDNCYLTCTALRELKIQEYRISSFILFEEDKNSQFLRVNNLARLKHGLKKLEVLRIDNCEAKVVFQVDSLGVLFPSLKVLELNCLPELESIWRGPACFLNVQNLSNQSVVRCHILRHIFSMTIARYLLQLKHLNIEHCSTLEQIIIQDDGQEQHQQSACFSNLSTIRVRMCKTLKSLFPISIARNLLQLKNIFIDCCEKMEQIIIQDDGEDQNSPKDHFQSVCFPNLTEISVAGCHKLKSLFHVNIARSLLRLEYLSIYHCNELEQAFAGDDYVSECKEIVLPVGQLDLRVLPRIVHFCPMGCHWIFPSLDHLGVISCPKIATRFSVDQNGSVHAKSEAPQKDNEKAAPTGIYCFSTGAIKLYLPPYMEE